MDVLDESPAGEAQVSAAGVERKWFIIQTLSGYEEKVKVNLEKLIEKEKMQDRIFKILIPEETAVEIKNGKRFEKLKKMYPGYVFVEMLLDDKTWYLIRQSPGVARFIGSKVSPTPVSDREMQRVFKQIGIKEEKEEIAFEIGESVKIISGPFRGYAGTVNEVNPHRLKLKALINIFGRDTPVEVDFNQVEKMV